MPGRHNVSQSKVASRKHTISEEVNSITCNLTAVRCEQNVLKALKYYTIIVGPNIFDPNCYHVDTDAVNIALQSSEITSNP